jgi:NADPH2:quinone reductase
MGTKNDLMSALKFVFSGDMKPAVGHIFDLKDIADAHRLMESRQTLGKVVIRVDEN